MPVKRKYVHMKNTTFPTAEGLSLEIITKQKARDANNFIAIVRRYNWTNWAGLSAVYK